MLVTVPLVREYTDVPLLLELMLRKLSSVVFKEVASTASEKFSTITPESRSKWNSTNSGLVVSEINVAAERGLSSDSSYKGFPSLS